MYAPSKKRGDMVTKKKKRTKDTKPIVVTKNVTGKHYTVLPEGYKSQDMIEVMSVRSSSGDKAVISAKVNARGKAGPLKAHRDMAGAKKRFPRITPAMPKLR